MAPTIFEETSCTFFPLASHLSSRPIPDKLEVMFIALRNFALSDVTLRNGIKHANQFNSTVATFHAKRND